MLDLEQFDATDILDFDIETGEIEGAEVPELSEEIIEQINNGQAYLDEDNITHVKEEDSNKSVNHYTGVAYEEACDLLRTLNGKKDFVSWTAGDIIVGLVEGVKGKKALGELVQRIAGDTQLDKDTITQYKWVAGKFPPGSERDEYTELTWSHFRAVAGLDDPKPFLEKAIDELWSVAKLTSEVSASKESKRIEQDSSCDRIGCDCGVSVVPGERVSAQIYGQKMTFCSAACLANVLINNLYIVKTKILDEPAHQESNQTIMVNNPDKDKRDKEPQEDWFNQRREEEMNQFRSRYGNIKVIKKASN